MESDRELLVLAAKAVNGTFSPGTTKRRTGETWDHWEWIGPLGISVGGCTTNPLTDDGAALRLAVALGLSIRRDSTDVGVFLRVRGMNCGELGVVPLRGDPYAATRRAIVRAAAALGRDLRDGDRAG